MSENSQTCNQVQMSMQSFSVNAIKKVQSHAEIISKFSIEEITDHGRYLKDQTSSSKFTLSGPILVFIGQQAHPEPESNTQYLMTSWAFIECFNNDYNIELLVTLWGPFEDGKYSIEFNTVSTNTMIIKYDNEVLGSISQAYRTCEAKPDEIKDVIKQCLNK
ncbi:hypothetical protein SJAV_21640 [Sulfurisphaera javensis]|uniref:Uncharacterized protein n=1 Tax=Sulfurisphaera javensis TaxID=2049879 RepID=A0AAT9GU42_9CREN